MPVKTAYYYPDSHRRGETSQMKRDFIQRFAHNFAIPRQKEKNVEALAVAPVNFYFYKKVSPNAGRRCSCWWPGPEADPKRLCPNCWGVGVVPGYAKHGTKTEIIDSTRQNVILNNVELDYETGLRPIAFTLKDTSTQGYIECSIPLTSNTGDLDLLKVDSDLPDGTEITPWIKSPSDTEWERMTYNAVQQRLGSGSIRFRIYLSRATPVVERPSVVNLVMRYVVSQNMIVQANIPRITEADTFSEIGIEESIGTMSLWFIHTMSHKIGNQDWFYRIDNNSFWKVADKQEFDPFQQGMAADVTVRHIKSHEIYVRYPV